MSTIVAYQKWGSQWIYKYVTTLANDVIVCEDGDYWLTFGEENIVAKWTIKLRKP